MIYTGPKKWMMDSIIFMTKHGSHAYGLNVPTSDLDIKGICIPPTTEFFSINSPFEQDDTNSNWGGSDCVVYSIIKFFRLATVCNPNIIEVIYTDPSDHLITTKWSDEILRNRSIFLSKDALKSFRGYAKSERHKLDNRQLAGREYDHGFDTKSGMHMVRLLTLCEEILIGEEINVKRKDRELLLSIRNGAWSYTKLMDWVDCQLLRLDELETKSPLPEKADRDKINSLLYDICTSKLGGFATG